jgi:AraC-like DNA-binding protein
MKLKIRYDDALPINAFRWSPRERQDALHFHDSLEVGLCLEGSGTFFFSERSYPVEPGDLFVVNNLDLHIAQATPGSACRFTFLNFDTSILLGEDERLLMPFAYHPRTFAHRIPATSASAPGLAVLVNQIHDEMSARRDGYRHAAKAALVLLCVGLLRLYASGLTPDDWTRSSRNFGKKRDLLTYMEGHYHYPLELADLAEYLAVTESGASRAFRETVGRSFRDHLNDLRVQDAKRRLLSTDASVTDVCFASGFQSIPSFYRQFHLATGLAPQDFRLRHPVGTIFQIEG